MRGTVNTAEHRTGSGDWCERLAVAIGDGRFLEDTGFWRPHVESCEACRRSVSGLFALREPGVCHRAEAHAS